MTPLGVDHFLEFLSIRRQCEVEGHGILASNLPVLREGESIYTTLEHQALYSAWKLGTTSEEKIRQRFLQTSMRVTFSTVVLPKTYPVDTLRQQGRPREGYETPQQTPAKTPVEKGKR